MWPLVIFAAIPQIRQGAPRGISNLEWVFLAALLVGVMVGGFVVYLRRSSPRNGVRTTHVRVGDGRVLEIFLRDEQAEPPKPEEPPQDS